jgi:S1-C subfamily serine protease
VFSALVVNKLLKEIRVETRLKSLTLCYCIIENKKIEMRDLLKYLVAGMIGGIMVLGGYSYVQEPDSQIPNYARSVNMDRSASTAGVVPNIDFVDASEKSMKVVVHIRAEESEVLAQKRIQEQREKRNYQDLFRFEDLFGGNMGSPFYKQRGSGSGVIISEDGFIVTNNHVVGFADNILVTLQDGKEYKAKKIGTDPSTDLAVIKIEESGLPILALANSDNCKVGEWVLAVGNPFDYLTSTVTAGIISAKGRDIDIIKGQKSIEEFIQTDAAINPGNSGGALVNVDGELLGINTAIATPTGAYAGYSFAIPSNLMKLIVDEIIANGDIERANLGVQGYEVDRVYAEEQELPIDYGFHITQIVNGSAAQFAGIIVGDIITNVDGNVIKDFEQLKEALKFSKVGDSIKVTVNRNGIDKTFNIRLKKGL